MKATINISAQTLGTVQIGLPYGIANRSGQPAEEESFQMLQSALDNGINTLDTAPIYGNAEEIIGKFQNRHEFVICSKYKLYDDSFSDTAKAIAEAIESLENSIQRLKVDQIDLLLLHQGPGQSVANINSVLPAINEALIATGKTKLAGLSLYNPADLDSLSYHPALGAIQAPLNLLDRRLIKCRQFTTLVQKGVLFFARSVYLQGLLLMDISSLPENLKIFQPALIKLHQLAGYYDYTITEMAYLFTRDCFGISSLVIGAENQAQLLANATLNGLPPLQERCINEILESQFMIPELMLLPANWNK